MKYRKNAIILLNEVLVMELSVSSPLHVEERLAQSWPNMEGLIYPFMFYGRRKVLWFWNDMRLCKWKESALVPMAFKWELWTIMSPKSSSLNVEDYQDQHLGLAELLIWMFALAAILFCWYKITNIVKIVLMHFYFAMKFSWFL